MAILCPRCQGNLMADYLGLAALVCISCGARYARMDGRLPPDGPTVTPIRREPTAEERQRTRAQAISERTLARR